MDNNHIAEVGKKVERFVDTNKTKKMCWCRDCKYYEQFNGVCCNADSDYRADFRDEYDSCKHCEMESERRYIDAELLKLQFAGDPKKRYSAEHIAAIIDITPAEKMKTEIHAKWIEEDRDVMGEMKLKCSHCNGFESGFSYPNYCKYCGADMRGDN